MRPGGGHVASRDQLVGQDVVVVVAATPVLRQELARARGLQGHRHHARAPARDPDHQLGDRRLVVAGQPQQERARAGHVVVREMAQHGVPVPALVQPLENGVTEIARAEVAGFGEQPHVAADRVLVALHLVVVEEQGRHRAVLRTRAHAGPDDVARRLVEADRVLEELPLLPHLLREAEIVHVHGEDGRDGHHVVGAEQVRELQHGVAAAGLAQQNGALAAAPAAADQLGHRLDLVADEQVAQPGGDADAGDARALDRVPHQVVVIGLVLVEGADEGHQQERRIPGVVVDDQRVAVEDDGHAPPRP